MFRHRSRLVRPLAEPTRRLRRGGGPLAAFLATSFLVTSVLATPNGFAAMFQTHNVALGQGSLSTVPTTPAPPTASSTLEDRGLPMIFEGEAGVVSEFRVLLTGGTPYTFQTYNLEPGSDPVLHVVDDFGRDLARDDNSGSGRAARLVFTPDETDHYRLLVRAANSQTHGRCDVALDGWEWLHDVEFGGLRTRLAGLRTNERLEVVRPPNGAGARVVSLLLAADGQQIASKRSGGNVSGMVSYRVPSALGTRDAIVAGHRVTLDVSLDKGPRRILIAGDTTTGTISDGSTSPSPPSIGGGWTAAFSSLSATAAFGGSLSFSDGPSVSFARRRPIGPDGPEIPPLVEDPGDLEPPEPIASPGATGGPLRLLRNDRYLPGHDDDRDWLGFELERALGTCARLRGIATGPNGHQFDCRRAVDPRDTDGDALLDGWEARGHVANGLPLPLWGADPRHKDLFIEVDFMRRTREENLAGAVSMMPAQVARDFAAAYASEGTTSPLRRLYQANLLNNPSGEPGVNVHLDTGVPSMNPADATIFGDWGGFNGVDAIRVDDEWKGQHANDVWQTEMSERRRGVFRYHLGYVGGGGQAGLGFGASYNLASSFVVAHETGHTFGLHHGGAPLREVDFNCKPNYKSLMNYAYGTSAGFSDGLGAPTLNNARLIEWEDALGRDDAYLDALEDVFRFRVDREAGHIDWNRDGVIAPQGQTVRAMANSTGGGCEGTRYNRVTLEGSTSEASPALVEVGGALHAFFVDPATSEVHYRFSRSSWECEAITQEGCDDASWSPAYTARLYAVGVDAERYLVGSQVVAAVVAIHPDGSLFERHLRYLGTTPIWQEPRRIAPVGTAIGEPSLAPTFDGRGLLLVTKRPDQTVELREWRNGAWGPAYSVADDDGVIVLEDRASPALFNTVLPAASTDRDLYGFFATEDHGLEAYRYVGISAGEARFQLRDVMEGLPPRNVYGRPAAAYVPPGPGDPVQGRFHLLWLRDREDEEKRPLFKMRTTHVLIRQTWEGPVEEIWLGRQMDFDNVWFTGFGADLFADYDAGPNVRPRALVATWVRDERGKLVFRPHADGIVNAPYANADDWQLIGVHLCRQMKGNDDPVACPPAP